MSATPRIPREPAVPPTPEIAEKIDFAESMSKLFSSGVGRFVEVQKKAIDVAAQQSTEVIDFWKKAVKKTPGVPGFFFLELAGSGIERTVEIQKGLVDLMAEQSRALAEMLKERTTATTKATEGVVKFSQQAMERSVATHKKTLEHTAAQTNAAFESVRKQFGGDGGPVDAAADSIQRGVNAIVEAQKDLLEVATR